MLAGMTDNDELLHHVAACVLGTEDRAKRWLETPKKALGGKVPLEHAHTPDGLKEVLELLERLQHGIFS